MISYKAAKYKSYEIIDFLSYKAFNKILTPSALICTGKTITKFVKFRSTRSATSSISSLFT